MASFKIKIDEAAVLRAAQPGVDRIQRQVNQTLQDTIREVNAEMSGQPADAVRSTLLARLNQRIAGATWNGPELDQYVDAIATGTLKDS